MLQIIRAPFATNFVAKIFKKSPNLVTLHVTSNRAFNFMIGSSYAKIILCHWVLAPYSFRLCCILSTSTAQICILQQKCETCGKYFSNESNESRRQFKALKRIQKTKSQYLFIPFLSILRNHSLKEVEIKFMLFFHSIE